MFFSFIIRLILILLILNALCNVIKNYRLLKTTLLSFKTTTAKTVIYIAITLGFIIFTVSFILTKENPLIIIMDAVVIIAVSSYLLYLVTIKSKITAEGLSVTLYGAYSWNEINKIELTDGLMTVYYQVKIPVVHSVKSFKVKLSKEKTDEISKIILQSNIHKKIIYIKS